MKIKDNVWGEFEVDVRNVIYGGDFCPRDFLADDEDVLKVEDAIKVVREYVNVLESIE